MFFFKSLANFELDNLNTKKSFIFGYGFEYKFRKTKKKFKIDTQIHTKKLIFFLHLNYLILNLQEICKIPKPKPKYSKN